MGRQTHELNILAFFTLIYEQPVSFTFSPTKEFWKEQGIQICQTLILSCAWRMWKWKIQGRVDNINSPCSCVPTKDASTPKPCLLSLLHSQFCYFSPLFSLPGVLAFQILCSTTSDIGPVSCSANLPDSLKYTNFFF